MSQTLYGYLAQEELSLQLPLCVLKSSRGFYLGTQNTEGPVSRESVEYFRHEKQATDALTTGRWTQRTAS